MRTSKIARLRQIRGEVFDDIVGGTFKTAAVKHAASVTPLDDLVQEFPTEYAATIARFGLKGKRKPRVARRKPSSEGVNSALVPFSPKQSDSKPKEKVSLEEVIASLPYPFHPASMIFPLGNMESLLSLAEKIKSRVLKRTIELLDGK